MEKQSTAPRRLKIKAFKLSQPTNEKNKAVYTTSLPIKTLVNENMFKINWWDKDKMGDLKNGYQRRPAESRIRKVANYFNNYDSPIFPSNILINSLRAIEFIPERGNFGDLIIDDYPLWIIDGQTRITGFKYAIEQLEMDRIKDYEIPVTILSKFELIEELEQFFVLNSFQKKVSTDLSQRLRYELLKKYKTERYEGMGIGKQWEMEALIIADDLNRDNDLDNLWYERIKLPNTRRSSHYAISQNSFITSLKPLFKKGFFEKYVKNADKRCEILKNFWLAVKSYFPEAFQFSKEYVIQRTPGVFSLHDLANEILLLIASEDKNFTKDGIYKKIKMAFSGFNSDFWRSDKREGASQYGSMKGFKMLAQRFKDNLPELISDEEMKI